MKKILMAIAAVALLIGCTKDVPNENQNQNEKAVTIKFSPYQVSPMKGGEKTTTSVATVCSRLDIYIIDIAAENQQDLSPLRRGTQHHRHGDIQRRSVLFCRG